MLLLAWLLRALIFKPCHSPRHNVALLNRKTPKNSEASEGKDDPGLYAQHVLWIRVCSIYQELDIIIGNGAGLTNPTNPTSQLSQLERSFMNLPCQPRALRPRAAVESPCLRPQLSWPQSGGALSQNASRYNETSQAVVMKVYVTSNSRSFDVLCLWWKFLFDMFASFCFPWPSCHTSRRSSVLSVLSGLVVAHVCGQSWWVSMALRTSGWVNLFACLVRTIKQARSAPQCPAYHCIFFNACFISLLLPRSS